MLALVLLFQAFSFAGMADSDRAYYGKEFQAFLENSEVDSAELKSELHRILKSWHVIPRNSKFHKIQKNCTGGGKCLRHRSHSYKVSRRKLFGELHLQKGSGRYLIHDVYCDKDMEHASIGPGKIPNSQVINTEHTWPQSRFGRSEKSMKKADLHALFPTSSKINSQRSNFPFADVERISEETCRAARRGRSASGSATYFEPAQNHKGNVARALFYFSIRYAKKIDTAQEATLRKWHRLDPVDRFERERHQKIYEFQQVRNPFIDFPNLVSKVSDF